MKVLITGGGGFLGKAIIKQLLFKKYSVRSFSRSYYQELESWGVEQIQGDLSNLSDVLKATVGCEVIYHVAAKAGHWGSYNDYYQTNVTGTENILKACLKNKIDRLVYTSTPSVVLDGKNHEGDNETLPYSSKIYSFYQQTKIEAEKKVAAANGNDLATVILRPHAIWGPEDNQLFPRILKKAKKKRLFFIGGGKNKIDTVYVDNAARAHLLAGEKLFLHSPISGKIYFITNDEPLEVNEIVNKLLECADLQPVEKSVSIKLAYFLAFIFEKFFYFFRIKSEPPLTRYVVAELSTSHWFNISAAKKDLGYFPEVSIKEGIKKMKEWLKTNPQL